jgi:putative FmdB family regulatory protein
MPTYEYECDACGHNFDEFQSYSDELLTKCPKCKKKKLRRLFGTGSSVIFKGSGFYETDYRSESYKSAAKAEQSAGEKKSDAGDKKSDSAGKADTTGSSATSETKTPKSSGKGPKSGK